MYGQASTLSYELVNNLARQSFTQDCDLATSNSYQSIPLRKDSKAIRLLELAPATGDAPISCSLVLADLDQQPGFVALSYVWSSFAPVPHTISCNSISLTVTKNCWDALCYLQRDPGKEDPGRHPDGSITLWVDATCINQADGHRKLDQIRLMGNIYSRASSVCICLGTGDWKTDKARSYLRIAAYQDFLIPDNEHSCKVPGIVYLHAGLRVIVARYRDLFHYHLLYPSKFWNKSIVDITMYLKFTF